MRISDWSSDVCSSDLAACIMPLSVALLRFTVPHHRLGMAIGWNALTVALSSAAGPTIGALILSGASWHWLFAVNLPLGVALLLAGRALPHVAGIDPTRVV